MHSKKLQNQKRVVPHFVGVCGHATYPVSENYAKQTLILHKPWRSYPKSDDWIGEFNNFINHESAPDGAKIMYKRAMQRYHSNTQFVESVASKPNLNRHGIDEETGVLLDLTGLGESENIDHEVALLRSMDKGDNFDWDRSAIERELVESHILPEEWLEIKTNEFQNKDTSSISVPLKNDGSKYQLEDLYEDQQFVISIVLQKLQEWLTCEDLSTFEPLRLTINGSAGCGKSVLINTLVTVLREMFQTDDVVKIAAPTGTAAFNVGGVTLHHLAKMGVTPSDYVPNSLTATRRKQLVKDFRCLLALIIDERSLINSRDLGTVERVMSETIHNGGHLEHMSFGGLPILILVGDDYQLPATSSGATDVLTCKIDKTTMLGRGRQIFLDCANHVVQMTNSRRLGKDNVQDKIIMEKVRIRDTLSEEEVSKLLNLHIDVMANRISDEELQHIKHNAIHLFFRNEPRIRHNLEQLSKEHSKERPVAFIRTVSNGSAGKAIASHFRNREAPETLICCVGSTVALDGRNFCPQWGLHNGAMGFVEEIVFDKNTNPNDGDLPKYVVVNFPAYNGPIWDKNNPKVSNKQQYKHWSYYHLT